MKSHLLKIILVSASLQASQAAILSEWNFSGLPGGTNDFGPSPFGATTLIDNATHSGLLRGSGVTTSGSGAAAAWGGSGLATSSQGAAISAGDYVTFTITPDSGYAISLSSISPYNIRRSSVGPDTGIWQYQVGSGEFIDIGTPITWGTTTSNNGNTQALIDLSAITALQELEEAVTFRVVNWRVASGGTNAGTWYFNGHSNGGSLPLTINGQITVVPEPAAAILGSVGFLCAVLRRRR